MNNAKALLTFVVLLISVFMYSASVALAGRDVSQSQDLEGQKNQEITDVQTQEVHGTVLRKEDQKLTVETDNGIKEFIVPENIKVTRNTFEEDIQAIQPNDRVNLIATDNGQVLSVDATSGEVFDWGRWALPGILIGLLIISMLYMAWKRTHQGHIKTEAPSV